MKQRKIIALCLLAAALALPGCGEKPAPDTQPPASSADTSAPTASAEVTTASAEVTTVSAEVTTDTDATSAPATAGTPAATTELPEATTETTATAATAEATSTATSAATSAADTTAATSATTEKNVNELIDIANSRQNGADYFVSPYRQISHIGDPFVLYDEASGKYYMYCTGGKFRCWSSDTFKSWTELGDA